MLCSLRQFILFKSIPGFNVFNDIWHIYLIKSGNVCSLEIKVFNSDNSYVFFLQYKCKSHFSIETLHVIENSQFSKNFHSVSISFVFLNHKSDYLKFCYIFCIFEMAWSRDFQKCIFYSFLVHFLQKFLTHDLILLKN